MPEHRETSTNYPWYSVEDKDGDGYIDVPDYDGDGVWGNTEWKYNDKLAELGAKYDEGFQDKTSRINFNKVTPPEYIKILGNKSGYTYLVRDTSLNAGDLENRTSNGLYHGVAENWKGFFGSTKFYYGPGENDFYQGPPKASEKNPNENLYEFIPNP